MNGTLKPLIIDAQVSIHATLGANGRSKRQITLVVDVEARLGGLAMVDDLSSVPPSDCRRDIGQMDDVEAPRSEFDSVFRG